MKSIGRSIGVGVSLLLLVSGVVFLFLDRGGWSLVCFVVGGIGMGIFGPPPNDTTGFDGLPT